MNSLLVSLPPNIYSPGVPPKITQHPSDQLNVIPGSTVEFTVAATTALEKLTYKWQSDGTDLDPLLEGVSCETVDTLCIDNVKKDHGGTYTCIVGNEI